MKQGTGALAARREDTVMIGVAAPTVGIPLPMLSKEAKYGRRAPGNVINAGTHVI